MLFIVCCLEIFVVIFVFILCFNEFIDFKWYLSLVILLFIEVIIVVIVFVILGFILIVCWYFFIIFIGLYFCVKLDKVLLWILLRNLCFC